MGKLLIAYALGLLAYIVLTKRAGGDRLSVSAYVPLCWMIYILTRGLKYWLHTGGELGRMETEIEGSSIDAAFLMLLILLGLRILYFRKINFKKIYEQNRGLFIFYGFALISLLWADFPLIGLKRWIKWGGSLIMALVILSEDDAKAAIRSLMRRCAYLLIPLSIIFIKFVPRLGRNITSHGAQEYRGVASGKNGYGLLLMILGLYFAWEIIVAWRSKDHQSLKQIWHIYAIFLTVIFWQLFFINSKTPTICLILGIALIYLITEPYFHNHARQVGIWIVILIMGAASLQYLFDVKSMVISAAGRDPTLTDRTLLWADILETPFNRWIGAGWDNYWLGDRIASLWAKWPWKPMAAHNGYLEIYLYLGWAGLVLLFIVLFGSLKKSIVEISADFYQGCLSLSFLIVALFYNYSEAAFHRLSPLWFFFLLFSCLTMYKQEIPNY